MLIRLFSDDKAGTALIIIIFTSLLWMPSFVSSDTVAFSIGVKPMPLYSLISRAFEGQVLISKIFAFIFLLFQAFMIVRLNARYILIQEKTFLPAFFFLAITGFYLPLMNFSEYLFGSFFFILMLHQLFSVYKQEPNSYRFFEAGLLLGIASLFYARLLYFLPLIWVVSIILRPFYWREWIYPVLGAFLPYVFILVYEYVTDYEGSIFELLFSNLGNFLHTFEFSWEVMTIIGLLFLFIAMASGYMLRIYQFRKIYIRNYYLIFFWLFVSSMVFFFVLTPFDPGVIYLFALPVSFILSNFFINSKKSLLSKILFTLYVVLILLNSIKEMIF